MWEFIQILFFIYLSIITLIIGWIGLTELGDCFMDEFGRTRGRVYWYIFLVAPLLGFLMTRVIF